LYIIAMNIKLNTTPHSKVYISEWVVVFLFIRLFRSQLCHCNNCNDG